MASVRKPDEFVRPKEACTGDLDGETFVLGPNDILTNRDRVVRKFPHLFKPLEANRARPQVEQATAAPGELRG